MDDVLGKNSKEKNVHRIWNFEAHCAICRCLFVHVFQAQIEIMTNAGHVQFHQLIEKFLSMFNNKSMSDHDKNQFLCLKFTENNLRENLFIDLAVYSQL